MTTKVYRGVCGSGRTKKEGVIGETRGREVFTIKRPDEVAYSMLGKRGHTYRIQVGTTGEVPLLTCVTSPPP